MNSADCLLGKMKRKRFMGPQGELAGALRAVELLAAPGAVTRSSFRTQMVARRGRLVECRISHEYADSRGT